MPIYEFQCPECGVKTEDIRRIGDINMKCNCGADMEKLINSPAMVFIRGMGGYPSRRKYFKGTAPYSGNSKEWNAHINNQFEEPEKVGYSIPSGL